MIRMRFSSYYVSFSGSSVVLVECKIPYYNTISALCLDSVKSLLSNNCAVLNEYSSIRMKKPSWHDIQFDGFISEPSTEMREADVMSKRQIYPEVKAGHNKIFAASNARFQFTETLQSMSNAIQSIPPPIMAYLSLVGASPG